MKSLKNKIQESLRIGLNDKPEMIKPEDWDELKQIILDRYNEEGPGTEKDPINFNDIDVSEFNSFYNNERFLGIFAQTDFKYINISEWNTSNIINMFSMFYSCKKLKLIYGLDKIDTSKVENMSAMFEGCTSLQSVPQFNTYNVKNMNSMFRNCKSLRSVPEFDLSNIKNITWMFGGCDNLDKQTIQIWNPDYHGNPQIK